jgi:hypothetical protein
LETIALVNRVFQQRRLLEGKSTENIGAITRIINEAHEESLREARERASKRREGEGAEDLAPVTGFDGIEKE